jgi:hypothetical protein
MWESLIGTRKSPLKQAGIIGLGTLFQVVTRSITLEDLVEKVCKRIGIKGRAIIWPHAEACMDVDKPHQLEIMREDLVKQQRRTARADSRKKAVAKSPKPKMAKAVKTKTTTGKKTKAAESTKTKSTVKAKSKKK